VRLRIAAVIAALGAASLCRGAAGSLEGTVRDSSLAVVPNALLSGIQEETGFRFSIESDSRGEYALALPEGHYNIIVRRFGFRTVAQMGVEVAAGAKVRIDFRLEPGSLFEAVTVADFADFRMTRALVDSSGAVIRPDELGVLPQNDRTVTGLLMFAPGLLITPANGGEPGQVSSLGARPNTNRYTVDGVSANNAVAGGGWPSFLPGARLPAMTALGTTHDLALYDAIEEVHVVSQGLTPAAGRAPGGNIVIQTRSGTNQFHGSLFYAGRPAALGAADWFANRYPLAHHDPHLSDEGASAGGPLRRDRTFFFISAERLDLRQVYSWTTTVPSLAARALAAAPLQGYINQFPVPNGPPLSFGIAELRGSSAHPAGLSAVNARLDHALTARRRAFLRFALTPSFSEGGFTQVDQSTYRNSVTVLGLASDSTAWTQDSRVSFSRTTAESRWLPAQGNGGAGGGFYSQFPSFAADFTSISVGGAGSVETGISGRDRQDQIQLSHAATWRAGAHHVRLGFEYLQLRPVRGGPQSNWDVAFSSPTDQVLGPPAPIWVTYSAVQSSASRLHQFSGFVQDTWRIHPRLMVTYGTRLLSALPPHAAPGSNLFLVNETAGGVTPSPIAAGAALWHGNRIAVDPAVSAAWRVPGSADTVLRASWTTIHDGDFAVATDQLNGSPYLSLRSPQGAQIFMASGLLPVQLGYGFAANLRLPVYQRWDVALQRSLTQHDSLALSYSGMTGSNLLRRDTVFFQPGFFEAGDLGQLSFATNHGASNYNGLSANYRHALAAGFTAKAGYTWSHSIDLGSSDSVLFLIRPGASSTTDRGPSDFDVRHSLTAALAYGIPARGPLRRFTGGWTVSGLLSARTAFPIDVLLSETLQGSAVSNYRPNRVPGEPLWILDGNAPGGQRLNPSAFAAPTGDVGNLGRNSVRGFGMRQTDLAVERPFRVRDGMQLRFRAEAFNVFNHPEFADPTRFLSNPMFGFSGSPLNLMLGSGTPVSGQSPAFQMGGPRVLQLSLRVSF
jgi:hypothetical protein